MKTSFSIFFLLLFSSINSGAQNWALPSSHWINTQYSAWSWHYGSTYLFVEKDTLIQSVHCAKVSSPGSHSYGAYTYSSGDTAYMLLNGIFSPVFYFNAHVGDTIVIYNDTSISYNGILFMHGIVDSINLISLNGQNLKKFSISIIDSLPYYLYPRQYVYAEKLGLLSTYETTFYQVFGSISDADSYELCNYGDSTISGFWLYPDSNCKTNVGIGDVPSDQSFDLYPNPATEYIHISLTSNQFQMKILDIAGREEPLLMLNDKIDIRDLSPGIYFISIAKTGSQVYTRRFIKE